MKEEEEKCGEVLRKYLLGDILTVQVVKNYITEEKADAIMNAAESNMKHNAGVAGSISSSGGPSI